MDEKSASCGVSNERLCSEWEESNRDWRHSMETNLKIGAYTTVPIYDVTVDEKLTIFNMSILSMSKIFRHELENDWKTEWSRL